VPCKAKNKGKCEVDQLYFFSIAMSDEKNKIIVNIIKKKHSFVKSFNKINIISKIKRKVKGAFIGRL
jgi:hypothetical protein